MSVFIAYFHILHKNNLINVFPPHLDFSMLSALLLQQMPQDLKILFFFRKHLVFIVNQSGIH